MLVGEVILHDEVNCIIERLGAELILIGTFAIFVSYFSNARHLYTDYMET